MESIWNLDAARRGRKNPLLKRARTTPGLWGSLAPEWNARDGEFVAGRSHLLHYTALHTQPWRPFPAHYAYQGSKEGGLWHDLERSANESGFEVFTAEQPTRDFHVLCKWIREAGAMRSPKKQPAKPPAAHLSAELSGDFDAAEANRTLVVGLEPGNRLADDNAFAALSQLCGPLAGAPRRDRVLCVDTLEYLPDDDVPWVVARLFEVAGRSVCVAIQEPCPPRPMGVARMLAARQRGEAWWVAIIERVARRFPAVHWKLIVHDSKHSRLVRVREGGSIGRIPKVWVLNDHKPGHWVQGQGLADALGWPYEVKRLQFDPLVYLHRGIARLVGVTEATALGLCAGTRRALCPPWPDLVIATGWKPARVARWIGRESLGRTRVVLLGRKGAPIADGPEILVSCPHFNLPAHPLRIETTLPLNGITAEKLQHAAARWESRFPGAPRPRLALLVGGATEFHRFRQREGLRLGREVRAFAAARNACVFAITSRRTGRAVTTALRHGLGPGAVLHEWHAGERDNPYLGFLAACDVLIVTGDSESMISEAVATGKPVLIYPLPCRRFLWRHLIASWVVATARRRPVNRRGTTRPQQGLEYLCARLIERNIVQPPRDLSVLYRALADRGRAAIFHGSQSLPQSADPDSANETFAVARAVKDRLGLTLVEPSTASQRRLPSPSGYPTV
jgi:mitochondrial fission protein ELM1